MMRGWTTALILMALLIPGLASSDIYSWVDGQGTQYYTTRFENIPEPYRSKAHVLSVPAPPPAPPELQSKSAEKGSARIPFTPGSPVLVSARINGAGPVTLILDPGAARTLMGSSALSRLGISPENATRTVIKGVTGMSDAS